MGIVNFLLLYERLLILRDLFKKDNNLSEGVSSRILLRYSSGASRLRGHICYV